MEVVLWGKMLEESENLCRVWIEHRLREVGSVFRDRFEKGD